MEHGSDVEPAWLQPERKPRVLVVDNDPALVLFLQLFLERTGVDVLTATDGRRALALAACAIPDLIVTDLRLPGMDGRQLREQLRSDPRTAHIPVLLLTAAAEADPESAFAAVLSKRLTPGDLIARIRRHVR